MSTIFFKSHEIIIHRQRARGTDKWAFSATFTGYQADIQPVTVERAELYGGRVGKVFTGWVDVLVDVKEGDQIVSGGRRYSVRTVSTFQGAGLLDHKEIILMSQDDDA